VALEFNSPDLVNVLSAFFDPSTEPALLEARVRQARANPFGQLYEPASAPATGLNETQLDAAPGSPRISNVPPAVGPLSLTSTRGTASPSSTRTIGAPGNERSTSIVRAANRDVSVS
jgi:hypothetical protein